MADKGGHTHTKKKNGIRGLLVRILAWGDGVKGG